MGGFEMGGFKGPRGPMGPQGIPLGPLGAPRGPLGPPRGPHEPPWATWAPLGTWGPKSIAMGANNFKTLAKN